MGTSGDEDANRGFVSHGGAPLVGRVGLGREKGGVLVVCWVFVVGAALVVIKDALEDVGEFEGEFFAVFGVLSDEPRELEVSLCIDSFELFPTVVRQGDGYSAAVVFIALSNNKSVELETVDRVRCGGHADGFEFGDVTNPHRTVVFQHGKYGDLASGKSGVNRLTVIN